MLRILKYVFLIWLVGSIVTAPFYWPYLRMMWVFNPIVAAPDVEPPANALEARQQDITYLSTLTDYDRAFNADARVAFDAALADMRSKLDEMTEAEFYLGIAAAVALADNGHSNISYRPQYTQFNALPIRLYWFQDELRILAADAPNAPLLGQRVVSIETRPVLQIREALAPYRGGNQIWRHLASTMMMESPELMQAAGLAESGETLTLEVEALDGVRSNVTLSGTRSADPSALPFRRAWMALTPDAFPEDWVHVLGAQLPEDLRFLQDTDAALSYALPKGGAYIRSLPGFAVGDEPIKRVYRNILSDIEDRSLDYLVVDFRLNDGGDYTKTMAFAKTAPNALKDDGVLYIITGPNTFSAGIVTVAMLKYYADGKAVIIGEPIGDREQFWAERGTSFRLPNSGYYLNYATGFHDWENGCKGDRYCFTMNVKHEVPAGSLQPEIPMNQEFGSYLRGEDDVLTWIIDQYADR